MDFFVEFISSSISALILAYFIYMIAGRKRKISIIVLSIMFIYQMIIVIGGFTLGYAIDVIILMFFYRAAPTLFAFFLFMTLTGGFGLQMIRRKKLKNLSTDIQTKRLTELTSIIVIALSILIGVLSYLLVQEPNYLIIVVSVISLGLGIYILITVKKIQIEKVILIVGKNKERIFSYDIPKNAMKVSIRDFYKNEMYIVDAIGEATLYVENKKYEKHYLYWIATSEKIDMKHEIVNEMRSLTYKDHLEHFEKYHYKKVIFEENRNGTATLIKEKVVR